MATNKSKKTQSKQTKVAVVEQPVVQIAEPTPEPTAQDFNVALHESLNSLDMLVNAFKAQAVAKNATIEEQRAIVSKLVAGLEPIESLIKLGQTVSPELQTHIDGIHTVISATRAFIAKEEKDPLILTFIKKSAPAPVVEKPAPVKSAPAPAPVKAAPKKIWWDDPRVDVLLSNPEIKPVVKIDGYVCTNVFDAISRRIEPKLPKRGDKPTQEWYETRARLILDATPEVIAYAMNLSEADAQSLVKAADERLVRKVVDYRRIARDARKTSVEHKPITSKTVDVATEEELENMFLSALPAESGKNVGNENRKARSR